MALSIMIYHLGSFGYLDGSHDASTALGKIGIYGVSIFFILSGLSMAIAYDKYINNFRSAGTFFIRRMFRIWLLLWLAVALVAVPAYFAGKPYSIAMIGMNLSTLFGFTFPHLYINMGAWSIGNEMVYYALTPLFIYAYHRRLWFGNAITVATAMAGAVFAFYLLSPTETLATQWKTYINPFNNLFLYCAGLAIYYNLRDLSSARRWRLPVLLMALALFFLYPSSGDQINIVTGYNRIAMSALLIWIVLAFYKFPPSLPAKLGIAFEQLGIATYGVYLLHPIVIYWMQKGFDSMEIKNPYLFVLLVVGLTITFALVTFKYIESPLIKIGKHVTNAISNHTRPVEAPAQLRPDQL